jgi:C4-dicarboxylate-specific signal transduction histidine kinase
MTVHVLFVDDDEANLVVCEAACNGEFPVLLASSAEAALESLERAEVGVIVADQRMPGTTGVELLERVRVEYPDTVRMLITAYSDIQAAIAAINRGRVRRYLRKPWEPGELKAELRDALDIYAMSRKLSALELRLRETERVYALGVVAAGVAHEMKNPMTWVASSLSFAQAELRKLAEQPGSASLKARLEEIEASLTDTRAGIERVIDIVRGMELPARSDGSSLGPVDVSEVLRLTLRLVSSELNRNAALELDVNGAPKVRASSTKLGQVLLNLIVNAVQAVSPRPRAENIVSVRLRLEGAYAVLEVADNGPGIPERDLERIFDPFFTSKAGVGTGLGLAISRRIVEECGGSLSAGRDDQLGGACFTVRLPLL